MRENLFEFRFNIHSPMLCRTSAPPYFWVLDNVCRESTFDTRESHAHWLSEIFNHSQPANTHFFQALLIYWHSNAHVIIISNLIPDHSRSPLQSFWWRGLWAKERSKHFQRLSVPQYSGWMPVKAYHWRESIQVQTGMPLLVMQTGSLFART